MRTRRQTLVAAGLTLLALCLTACGGDGEASSDATDDETSASSSPDSTPDGTSSGSPEPSSSGGTSSPGDEPTPTDAASALPVYYLADDGQDLRLYREFHRIPAGDQVGRTAVEEMLKGDPVDPDYVSFWPTATKVLGYSVDDGVATVDLSAAALDGTGGAQAEARSVQQLVWTVTAADTTVDSVRLLVEGEEVDDLWGHGAVGDQPLERAPALDVQGLVWIIDPSQGARVGSPFVVRVYGTAFEGNVTLVVTQGTREVERTFVTTMMGGFAAASTELALEPGDYTITAYDESGEDGTLTPRDSKDFTVV